jgi:hypothetical protein
MLCTIRIRLFFYADLPCSGSGSYPKTWPTYKKFNFKVIMLGLQRHCKKFIDFCFKKVGLRSTSTGPGCPSGSGCGKMVLIRPHPDPQHNPESCTDNQLYLAMHLQRLANSSTIQYGILPSHPSL